MTASRFHTKRDVERFATVLIAATASFPEPVRVPGKPSSIMQPLRYAIKVQAKQRFPVLGLDSSAFFAIAEKLCVYERDGVAWVGPKPTRSVQTIPVESKAPTYTLDEPYFAATLCELVAANALVPQPRFIVRLTEPQRQELLRLYSVNLMPRPEPGYYEIV